jgi:ribosomal protein L11
LVKEQERTAMASRKRVAATVRIQLQARQASPGKVGQSFGTHGLNIVAFIAAYNRARLREIARTKLPDLNTDDLEAAERIVAGTARSMGIELVDAK